jgi:hypothetical protein
MDLSADMTQPFDDLRRYADDLATEVSPFTAHRAVRSAMSPDVRRPRKAVVALVATGLLGLSNVALAATADAAVPGDALYGMDRAYEQVFDFVGIENARVAERLQEAGVLVERGELGVALDLVQETLTKVLESDDPEAEFEALVSEVANVPDAVADVVFEGLVKIARATASSDEPGADVREAARLLGQQLRDLLSGRPDDAGPPDGSPSDTRPSPSIPEPGGNQP